ncbi:chemotaxis protein histidine kinase CheA [Rhodopseudomonas rhenobacensis]|uniref:Chemotaxis protein histidine kinase CheA n=1 Tax=Rhodopseudomonas rhenobacensis TaxID=87461 RepID=A0A7W8DZG8_9BRAD|nr:Hpt domain-containing protein [Rhodopseudomonas rhenobacensis]MBB5047852.1 chemotaxis protein histidine kinase CheA [Rhodopseudomonas rhenobacensis]
MAKAKTSAVHVEAFADHHVITPPNPLRGVLRAVDDKDRDDPIARAERALAGLSGEFDAWMASECERLRAAHAAILKDGFSKATRDELFRAAHDIKGDATTFGYPTASVAAESLCRIIEHAPQLDQVPAELIANHIKAILAIVREHAQIDKAGVEHELSRRLRAVADEYLAAVNHDRPEHLEAILSPGIAPAE